MQSNVRKLTCLTRKNTIKLVVFAFCLFFFTPVFSSETIGDYKYSYLTIQADVSVVKVDDKLMMYWRFHNGSTWDNEMVEISEEGQTRLVQKTERRFGEYFLRDKDGNLGVYDDQGHITTMEMVK